MISIPVKSSSGIQFTYIDFEDLHILGYKWYKMKSGYIFRNKLKAEPGNRGIKLLHREIMNPSKKLTVDHINRDRADNRRTNLRIVSQQDQNMNMSVHKDNKSKIQGVYKRTDCNRWSAFIQLNKKHEYLGLFKTQEDAIKARLNRESELFGNFKKVKS